VERDQQAVLDEVARHQIWLACEINELGKLLNDPEAYAAAVVQFSVRLNSQWVPIAEHFLAKMKRITEAN
jgi:hypothetical protein